MTNRESPPKAIKRKRGRPVGWRKPNALRCIVMIRLAEAPLRWLRAQTRSRRVHTSEIIRSLLERAMIDGLPRPFTRAEEEKISSATRSEARRLLRRKKI